MTDLKALAERLEKATGADREIDALLWAECDDRDVRVAYGEVIARSRANGDDVRLGFVDPTPLRSNFYGWNGELYTSSLDAAVSLCERALPGWDWSVHSHKQHETPSYRDAWAGVRALPKGIVSGVLYETNAYTPALALCLAIVRAKLAEQSHD